MKSLAAVSVIIPCYRCTATLERALASVLAQTLPAAEVVLVDDASGDDTRALLFDLQARFAPGWIKLVLLDTNVGAGSARNAGWDHATQPWVAFLDADDAWHFRKLEIQCAYMAAHPDVAMCGHGYRLLKQGILPYWEVKKVPAQTIGKWRMMLSNRFVTPSVMLQRDLPHRFEERQRYMEDHMLWLKVVCSGARVVKLPLDLAAIYKSPFGVTGLSSRVWLMERSDLGNYHRLYKSGHLKTWQLSLLALYSAVKYVRRLLFYALFLRWTSRNKPNPR